LLDRSDLQVDVAPVAYREIGGDPKGDASAAVAGRVAAARARQHHRCAGHCNADMTTRELDVHARPDAAGGALLERAMSRLGLSARAYTRILRVARTIADLAGAESVGAMHVAEAVQYRTLDRRPTALGGAR